MSTWVVRKPTAGAGTTDASSTVWSELYDVAASRSGSLRFSRHVPAPARQLVRRDAARRSIVSNSQTVDALGWCENRVVGIELRAHGGAAQLASQSRQFAAWSHAHAHAHARTHTRTHARARAHLFLKAKPPSNGCCSACGTCLSDGGTEPAFPSDIAMLPTGMTCLSLSGSLAESVSLSLALSLVCARARVRACACACVCVRVRVRVCLSRVQPNRARLHASYRVNGPNKIDLSRVNRHPHGHPFIAIMIAMPIQECDCKFVVFQRYLTPAIWQGRGRKTGGGWL